MRSILEFTYFTACRLRFGGGWGNGDKANNGMFVVFLNSLMLLRVAYGLQGDLRRREDK